MTEPKPKRPWWQTALIAIVGLFVVCCIIGALFGRNGPQSATIGTPGPSPTSGLPAPPTLPPTATLLPGAAPTQAPAPTEAPAPTAAPLPTAPPAPTAIPPTAAPPPTLAPTAVPPQLLQGSGKKVQPVVIASLSRLTLTHDGKRNFAVVAYPADGSSQELLVNTIGSYEGVRWLPPGSYNLEITADGGWTIGIAEFTREDTVAVGLLGKGDYVSGVFVPLGTNVAYTYTHDGKRNFAVILYCSDGQDLVANEIGPTQGEAIAQARGDACFWDVSADGNWSIAKK